MELDYKAIGRRMKEKRMERGLTQEQIVDLTGISNSHISNIETGKTKVGLPTLVLIANCLQVTTDDLLCDNLVSSVNTYKNEISKVTEDCDDIEVRIIADTCKALKSSLRERANQGWKLSALAEDV